MTKKEASSLDVMFPGEEVELWPDRKVRVRPLFLEDIPKVLDLFTGLIEDYKETKSLSPGQIADKISKSLIKIAPLCIRELDSDESVEARYIPLAKVPDIVDIVRKQNFPPESLGKWKALFTEATGLLDKQGLAAVTSEK